MMLQEGCPPMRAFYIVHMYFVVTMYIENDGCFLNPTKPLGSPQATKSSWGLRPVTSLMVLTERIKDQGQGLGYVFLDFI
jgi:hypothetical protein